jgi:hypothetical protein
MIILTDRPINRKIKGIKYIILSAVIIKYLMLSRVILNDLALEQAMFG